MKILFAIFVILLYCQTAYAECPKYDRKQYHFDASKSPVQDATIGYYTQIHRAKGTDIDHINSLHDIHQSGGCYLSSAKKRQIANDPDNHAPSIPVVNRVIKRAKTPRAFIEAMAKSKYEFINKCGYLKKYVDFKIKWQLSFANNDMPFIKKELESCG